MRDKKQITKEIISGEQAAHALFTIVATLYGKDEYFRSKAFTDDITPEDDAKNKRDCEIKIRSVLAEIASSPEEGTIKPLHDMIMAQPPVVRAYIMVWFGEMSEDLFRMKTVEIPDPPSLQGIVQYLLRSATPFWGGQELVEKQPPIVALNFYDYIKKRCDNLFPYVEKEIANLKEKRLSGPFHNMDEYAVYGRDYLKSEVEVLAGHMFGYYAESFGELRARELLAEFQKSQDMEKAVHSFETNYTTVVNFELYGRKAFYITNNLYEHLAQTSIDTACELARLPFPSCLFVYDSPQAIDLLYQIGGHKPHTYKGAVSVFASEVLEKNERKLLLYVFHADMNEAHLAIKRQLLLRQNWSLEQALRTDWLKLNPGEEADTSSITISDDNFYTSGLHFFRTIVNTILYLSSNDPDLMEQLSPYPQIEERLGKTKSSVKRKNTKSELKRTSRSDYIVVGRNIPRLMPDRIDVSIDSTKRALHSRFIVRGHWRNQPYGPDNSLHRTVWIKPYYKGPEISEVIKNRPYIVS